MRLPSRLETAIRDISMRNYYLLLWVLLFVEGVSGDGNEEVEVSVTKEDSITLPGFPGVQKTDQIVWKFEGVIIFQLEEAEGVFKKSEDERFKDRLDLNNTTGALTITQVTPKHAGRYQLDINNKTNLRSKIFRFSVYDFVEPRIREGDTVTLHTGVPQIQEGGQIVWKFKDKIIYPSKGSDDTSWSNFHLNDQTGGLTITHIRIDQSGDYEVEINSSSMILHRIFHINISGEMKTVSVREGESIILHTDLYEKQGYDLILWKFGDRPIANQLLPNDSIDERFKGRLRLDRESGDLIIRGSKSTDSGVYHLDMSSSSYSVQRSISVTVKTPDKPTPDPGLSSVPDKPAPVSGLSSAAVAGIVVVLLLVFAAVIAAAVIYHRRKITELERRMDVEKNGTNVPLNAETANSGAS